MPHLVCYDIENDRKRKKIADKLLEYGLERVQYSVFMGVFSTILKRRFTVWLEGILDLKEFPNDSVLIIRLSSQEVTDMIVVGNSKLDKEEIAGLKNTLFI